MVHSLAGCGKTIFPHRDSKTYTSRRGKLPYRMLKKSRLLTRPTLARRDAPCPSKAAGESKLEAYPHGYVEDFDEPRTTLADFFSIRIKGLTLADGLNARQPQAVGDVHHRT